MRVKLLVTCLAVCATASSAFAAQPPDTSVTYQVSPTHAGEVPASTLEPPFERAWIRFDLGATSYPVIAQGLVVVAHPTGGSRDGATVTALDAKTGETVWSMPLGGDTYPFGGVAYEDGRVYALNAAGMMRGIDAATGTLLWERKLPQRSFNSPPTASDGLVYTAGSGSGGTLSAVVGATGAIAWTAPVQNGDESSPAVDDSRVYVSYSCHTVYGFDRVTGARLWWHRTGCSGGGGHTPTVFGGRVYTRELNDWDGLVLDAATGGELGPFHSSTLPAFSLGTMVYREGAVLRGDNALGGWAFSGDGQLSSTPIIANGVAYVGSSSGRVYGVDVLDGTLVWQGHAGAPVPWPTNQSVQSKTGLGAGQGVLIVPTTHGVTAFSEVPVIPTPTPTPEPTPAETPTPEPTPTPTPTVKPPLTSGSPLRERGIRILTPRPWHRPVVPRLAALSRPHG